MAKAAKYSKKFRMKLEKVAEKRAEREAEAAHEHDTERVFATLFHEFLPKGSVHFMHTKLNDEQTRMETTYHMHPGYKHGYARSTPPWPPLEKPDPE
jgi:hypothetical protein